MKKFIFIIIQLLYFDITLAITTQDKFDQGTIDLQARINDLKAKPSLTLPLEEEIELLKQLDSFDLGRFLLRHGKLNSYWRSYFIFEAPKKKLTNPLEDWYVNKSPIAIATRERFDIFQQEVKSYLAECTNAKVIKIASIPCGMMYDLLTINYETSNNIELIGIDVDSKLLKLAQINSEVYSKQDITKFIDRDAWNLNIHEEFDVIVSHGLTIYEGDISKIINLYKEFYTSLKKGGILITSFLTPSPDMSSNSPWQNYDQADLLKEIALYKDIVRIHTHYYTEKDIRKYLQIAGFKVIKVINGSGHIFPTVVAQKIL